MAAVAAVPALADSVVYDNTTGYSYDTSAWAILGPYSIANSFTLTQATEITGADFAAWVYTGDTLTSVNWSITDTAFGTVVASGTATDLGNVYLNSPEVYNDNLESFSIPDLDLASGTYWLQLGKAVTADSSVAYWDTSDGASQEANNFGATIGSETFQILGVPGAVTPEPSSFLLLGSGLLGLAGLMRRKLRA